MSSPTHERLWSLFDQIVITKDTSAWGWGLIAILGGGSWGPCHKSLLSNPQELLALWEALLTFCSTVQELRWYILTKQIEEK